MDYSFRRLIEMAKHLLGQHDQKTHGHITGAGEDGNAKWISARRLPNGTTVTLIKGDLTKQHVRAIVNAANSRLAHGGGLAGAIVRNGGESIQRESDAWVKQHGEVTQRSPAVTRAGTLPAHYVIHAVAPVWDEHEQAKSFALLKTAYFTALAKADELGLKSVAFASLGTGIFGVPVQVGARAARTAVDEYFNQHPKTRVEDVRFVIWDDKTVDVFRNYI